MTETEKAWLAGVLEGEAWFGLHKNGHGKKIPIITVSMSDRDVVERVAMLIGNNAVVTDKQRPGCKPLYRARARGSTARQIMESILTYMGERRTLRIRELLAEGASNG